MSRVSVIQSSYVPWKGYFDIIRLSDEFVLYDDVQYAKNDWRNRNLIKTRQGTAWLTIPVRTTGRFGQKIDEVEVVDSRWAGKHWRSIQAHYAKAPHFDELAAALRGWYDRASEERLLTRINELFIRGICRTVGITTRITRSEEYDLPDDRVERLLALCEQLGASEYISGPSARDYLDQDVFERRGVEVHWMDYSGYGEYDQLFTPPFVHQVTMLDLLLNEGPQGSLRYLETSGEGDDHQSA